MNIDEILRMLRNVKQFNYVRLRALSRRYFAGGGAPTVYKRRRRRRRSAALMAKNSEVQGRRSLWDRGHVPQYL